MITFPLHQATTAERWAAALSYIGVGALVALLMGRRGFLLPHARLAFALHLGRLLVAGFGLGLWHFLRAGQGALSAGELLAWFWHLAGLFVLGVPLTPFGGHDLAVWLVPVGLIWLIDLTGFVLALQGRSWPWDTAAPASNLPAAPQEKEHLRRLRDRRLQQISYATTTASSERLRERRIAESKRELGANLVRLDHLNHLLAISELSASRYGELTAGVHDEIDALRDELAVMGARVSRSVHVRPASGERLAALGGQLQARTLSLSFVDHSGLPLFTYGHFPLDEALIAGMLSAINSLSQEIFGSPMHKTQLAEGQVLYFVHGQWSVLMALFDAEPSPVQTNRLQNALSDFEARNAVELQRNPVEPARLAPVSIDFELTLPE